jgi:hypothetical protein
MTESRGVTERPRHDALEQVRELLFPDLPPAEGRDQVAAAILGRDDPQRWATIERMAAANPELFADLVRAIERRRRAGDGP